MLALERFRNDYNSVRPHEALDFRTPASVYRPSPRLFSDDLCDPDYPDHFEVRCLKANGCTKVNGAEFVIGAVLRGECVGLEPLDDGLWHVWVRSEFGAAAGHVRTRDRALTIAVPGSRLNARSTRAPNSHHERRVAGSQHLFELLG